MGFKSLRYIDFDAQMLADYNLIFFDFDGVIKESVSIKIDCFIKLFKDFPTELQLRIKSNEVESSGIPRSVKLPKYLNWSMEYGDTRSLDCLHKAFSELVVKRVISSEWVPGAREFLLGDEKKHVFCLISATPDEEIITILEALNIDNCFSYVYGSSKSKDEAIRESLKRLRIKNSEALFIGDSYQDFISAANNRIDFLHRQSLVSTRLEMVQSMHYRGTIRDFTTRTEIE